jgi:hypothetical protein
MLPVPDTIIFNFLGGLASLSYCFSKKFSVVISFYIYITLILLGAGEVAARALLIQAVAEVQLTVKQDALPHLKLKCSFI